MASKVLVRLLRHQDAFIYLVLMLEAVKSRRSWTLPSAYIFNENQQKSMLCNLFDSTLL